ENLYLGTRTLVYRGTRHSDSEPVIIKLLRNPHPNFNELVQFRNQYIITRNLEHPAIVRPLALERYGNGYALVMPDGGEMSLWDYWQQQKEGSLTEFLAIAIQLSEALHYLTLERIVHKDIKPSNILIHPETGLVKLIDFSISSLLPKEQQQLANPNVLEGTLAYISPEQTGRMNRGIDYRTDFYSLGVTFFQLLVGQLPFSTSDPMELVHCHIARAVQFSADSEVPVALQAIVRKLMAKNAEDRYQSAMGIKHDLELCLQKLEATGEIASFEIGTQDRSDRFIIPEKLYGRESEVQALLDAFSRVALGKTEMMLVAGFSGIGKTAVVNEVHKPIVEKRGYFIKGKFDQFNRNVPFSAFVQAFRDLMGQLLGSSDAELEEWKASILEAVGENGQVIIDAIPSLQRIIGKQPPVAELSGSAAQNRFNLFFGKFVRVFTTIEHPLVIFLDDLQWADLASLNLLKLLMDESEGGYLLVLGAYRDNEVFPAHPLMLQLDELQKERAVISTITLEPLAFHHINLLVADTLSCKKEQVLPLSELLYEKTRGNPFFTTQFLKGLYEEKLVAFDRNLGYWECDLSKVRETALTDDVVEFMAGRLQKLPQETQNILKLAACIGNQFDLETLAIVSEQSWEDVAANLWGALQEGLVLPVSETYKFFRGVESDIEPTPAVSVEYRFLHDRVQQAAYSLIAENRKQSSHLNIGRLLQRARWEPTDSDVFKIVNQFNQCLDIINSPEETVAIAKLNHIAATKARETTAFVAATEYALVGIQLLGEDAWQGNYDLMLALRNCLAEGAYLSGSFELANESIADILSNARTLEDRGSAYEVKLQALKAQNQFQEAISLGLKILDLLEIPLPEEVTPSDVERAFVEMETALEGRAISDLLDLEEMSDRAMLAATRIICSLLPVVHMVQIDLLPILVFQQVKLALRYGNAPAHTHAYSSLGVIFCGFRGDIERGYQAGQLALALLERIEAEPFRAATTFVATYFTLPWKVPIQSTFNLMLKAYASGANTGDLEHACFAAERYGQLAYFSGAVELSDLATQMDGFAEFMRKKRQDSILQIHSIYHQVVLNWQGKSTDPLMLAGTVYDESIQLPRALEQNYRLAVFYYYLNKLILAYSFFDDSRIVAGYATQAREYIDGGTASIMMPLFHTYDSLAWLQNYLDASPQKQKQYLTTIDANQEKIENWAMHAPANYSHKHALVEAELFRVRRKKYEAADFYDRAIAGAKENGFIQEEALANELAAKFYLEWGKEKIAATYIQSAYYCYARWGAKAKTDQLEVKYPQLLTPILQKQRVEFNPIDSLDALTKTLTSVRQDATRTGTHISEALDFASILQAAQTLSSTMELDRLLAKIVRIILTNAGAQKTVLLVPQEEQWQLRAMAQLTEDGSVETSTKSRSLAADSPVPVRLVRYVKNTKEPVLIEEAKTEIAGIIEGYLLKYQPQSAFCVPLLERGNLVAILYLEHPTTKRVFTRNRQTIIEFLCAQAASALENARLYSQSKSYVERLERSLNNLQITQIKLIENEQIMQKQVLAISNLSQSKAISSGELKTSFQELTTATARTLQVERASIWLFDKEQIKIYCVDLFESSKEHHSQGFEIFFNDNPNYFSAINLEALLVSNDAQNDPKTTDFKEDYLVPLNIVSMLDANVLLDGKIYGILCCEQVGSKRVWTQAEQNFVRSVANLVALTLEANLRRQKEEKLERALVDLKQSQLQLVQSEKMSALGNLVAGVAHEINNPVGFLQGNIEPARKYVEDLLGLIDLLLAKCPSNDPQIETEIEEIDLEFIREDLPKLLESMTVGIECIGNISNSLRTFSRKDRENKTEFDIHEGIDSTLLILKHRTKANQERPAVEIVKDYGDIPVVQCFPGQLNQVFMNIFANAIDAFDEANEGKTYSEIKANRNRISIGTSVLNEERVQIEITDNGCGMKPETLDRIFEQGFTTKGVGKGTGLGMAIAYNIITEKHGGTITCDSKLGVGTTFTIELPAN
ncbi:MAG: AAA family ATPase, partial [Cyanobacteriota bacterium]|nr:AAA family ATPase [Cyanobacteriota bacterium]